jgi:hypothetical protein
VNFDRNNQLRYQNHYIAINGLEMSKQRFIQAAIFGGFRQAIDLGFINVSINQMRLLLLSNCLQTQLFEGCVESHEATLENVRVPLYRGSIEIISILRLRRGTSALPVPAQISQKSFDNILF